MRTGKVLGCLGVLFLTSVLTAGIVQRVRAENAVFIEFKPILEEDTDRLTEINLKGNFVLQAVSHDEDYEESLWAEMYEEEMASSEEVVESSSETEIEVEYIEEIPFRVMSVNGATLDPDLQLHLFNELKEYDMEWFAPYAMCQMYQESRFDPYAVSPNGMDKGILQFREIYWDWFCDETGIRGDIFDARTQISIYVDRVAKYFAETGDLDTVISNHYTGGCGYAAEYVASVLGWMNTLIR